MLKTLLHEQQDALTAVYEKKKDKYDKAYDALAGKTQAIKAMNAKLKELGFKATVKEKDIEEKNGVGKMTTVATIKIDPKETGPLAPVFSSIELEISVGYSSRSDIGQITLQYSWQHPSGSNGYQISYVLREGQWEDM